MLKYKVMDLLLAAKSGEVNVIAQQCNCFNARKRGIAPLLDKAFPEVAIADDSTIKGDPKKFGDFSYAHSPLYNLSIYNLYGQWGWWKREDGKPNTDLDKLESSFKAMSKQLMLFENQDLKIGLPKLGAGLGGAEWSSVEDIIKKTLCEAGYNVTIYVLDEAEIPENATVIK
ncbi:putative phosphatase [Klebsiella phage vB_KpM_FBKp34]|nr:putative phosphatase [Klebsiella phage vB_KpM_FBKp34]